jgi:CheY-like chemotaxis protein
MVAILAVGMVVIFILSDILIRVVSARIREAKARKERLAALDIGLNLNFTDEAKSLKRVEIASPVARILAVDDEPVILDSFRKILVVAGYAIDTVESGREALGLVQKNKYDFVFTDLKMPEMDGLDVIKGVKHFSPETDIIVITGFATVETAVDAMKFGAMDYVQKPFTEDELVEFTKKCLIRRRSRLGKQIDPMVRVAAGERPMEHEFLLPGGVFISEGHVWASVTVPGLVRIGMDDFARKMIGRIDGVELPAKGAAARKGEKLFSIRQGGRTAEFRAPVTGTIQSVNSELAHNLGWFEKQLYDKGWVCSIKPEHLSAELENLKIGEKAAAWYQEEIQRVRRLLAPGQESGSNADLDEIGLLVEGQLEETDDMVWRRFVDTFLARTDGSASASASVH